MSRRKYNGTPCSFLSFLIEYVFQIRINKLVSIIEYLKKEINNLRLFEPIC